MYNYVAVQCAYTRLWFVSTCVEHAFLASESTKHRPDSNFTTYHNRTQVRNWQLRKQGIKKALGPCVAKAYSLFYKGPAHGGPTRPPNGLRMQPRIYTRTYSMGRYRTSLCSSPFSMVPSSKEYRTVVHTPKHGTRLKR